MALESSIKKRSRIKSGSKLQKHNSNCYQQDRAFKNSRKSDNDENENKHTW